MPREFRSSGDVGRNRRKKLRGQIFRTGRRDARHRQNFCRLIFFTVFLFPSRHLLQQLLLLPLALVSVVARTGERRVVVTFWFSALTTKKNLFYSELLITQCPNASADLKKMNKATIRWRKNSVFCIFTNLLKCFDSISVDWKNGFQLNWFVPNKKSLFVFWSKNCSTLRSQVTELIMRSNSSTSKWILKKNGVGQLRWITSLGVEGGKALTKKLSYLTMNHDLDES